MRKPLYILAGIVIVLGAARVALPHFVKYYVNRQLQKSKTYSGSVGDISIALWRGAYKIHNLKILKRNGRVPAPFFSADYLDLSVDWAALLHHRIVAKIYMERPHLNFVKGPTAQQTQAGENTSWNQMLENLVPFQLNQLEIHDGQIRYDDPYSNPKVNLYFNELGASATNLSNAKHQALELPAGIRAHAMTIGHGSMFFHLQFNPVAPAPEYQLQASLTNVDLPALNDFFRAYAGFDVARGQFAMFTSVAATNRAYVGYIKVFFDHLDVFSWQKEHTKDVLEIFWDAIVGAVTDILKNQPHDRLATKIPISGVYTNSQVNLISTIGTLLRNAFVRALIPKFDQKITTSQVTKMVHQGQVPNATTNGNPTNSSSASAQAPGPPVRTPPSATKRHGATILEQAEEPTNSPAHP